MNIPVATSAQTKRTLVVVMMTVLLDLIGFGILIPIQPFLALSFGARPGIVTMLSASFSLMQFLFMPMWGALSDRVGRRPIMLISIAVSTLGFTLFAFADSLVWLFVARMIAGFGSANIGIAQAIIADNTSGHDRAKGMGYIGAAFGLGFMIGPAIGGVFGQFGLQVPGFIAAGLSLLNLFLAWFLLAETRSFKTSPGEKKRVQLNPFMAIAKLKKTHVNPDVVKLLLLSFVFTLGFSLFEQSLGLFIGFHWAAGESARAVQLTAYFMIMVGFTAAFVQGGLTGRLVPKVGEPKLLRIGFTGLILALLLVPLIGALKTFPLLIGLGVFSASCTGMILPSLSGLLSRFTHEDEQGAVLGLGQSLSALGRAIGPLFSGFLFEQYSGAPFLCASLIMIVGLTLVLTLAPRSATTNIT
jgi:DHA1 family tetracycline resistance protein-like MFS transporter